MGPRQRDAGFSSRWLNRPSMKWLAPHSETPQKDDEFVHSPTRRISTLASQRLTAITEDSSSVSTADVPTRNPMRHSAPVPTSTPPSSGTPTKWSARRSRFSEDTDVDRVGPPSYEWVANPSEETVLNPADDEKLVALRSGNPTRGSRRGGWGRLAVIVAVVLAIIGLAVGLGVGLSQKHSGGSSGQGQQSGSGSPTAPSSVSHDFPLGSYYVSANLASAQTNCTSNPITWRCFPYNDQVDISLGWQITNTSSEYPTGDSSTVTSSAGVPANLTISALNNPFAVSFTNQSLTYISPSSDTGDARLIFEFTMTKSVVPNGPITTNDLPTECFFNSTSYMGTLYLSSQADGKVPSTPNKQWPFPVVITQSAAGGPNVPNCYESESGVGVGIGTEPSSETCLCVYKNH